MMHRTLVYLEFSRRSLFTVELLVKQLRINIDRMIRGQLIVELLVLLMQLVQSVPEVTFQF